MIGGILLFLMTSVCGCSNEKLVTVPQVVYVTPPSVLLEQVTAPAFTGTTNGDLIEYILELRDALSEANAKLRAIGKWRLTLTGDGTDTDKQ